jgi:hypothetical protein
MKGLSEDVEVKSTAMAGGKSVTKPRFFGAKGDILGTFERKTRPETTAASLASHGTAEPNGGR